MLDGVIVRATYGNMTPRYKTICKDCLGKVDGSYQVEAPGPLCPIQPQREKYSTDAAYKRSLARLYSCHDCGFPLLQVG